MRRVSKRHGIGSHTRPNKGVSDEWLTPPEIVQALGPFDLDPCCPPDMPWQTARRMIDRSRDGLTMRWHGRVWLNPPYSQAAKWLAKLAEHGDGIAIVFARTETKLFFEHVWPFASALLFIQGRPHFYLPDGQRANGNSGGPVVLLAYGEGNAAWLAASKIPGALLRRPWQLLSRAAEGG